MKKDIKDFFDKLALTWDKEQNPKSNRISLIKSLPIKKRDFILDLGCGTGIISKDLYNLSGRTIVGLDISREMIKIAKTKYSSDIVTYINEDFYDYKSYILFDMIVVFNAYPHFTDINEFKKSIDRNLKKGGYLAIVHDDSKENINNYHINLDNNIKRFIDEPLKEYEYFKDSFDLIKEEDTKDSYLLVIKKL